MLTSSTFLRFKKTPDKKQDEIAQIIAAFSKEEDILFLYYAADKDSQQSKEIKKWLQTKEPSGDGPFTRFYAKLDLLLNTDELLKEYRTAVYSSLYTKEKPDLFREFLTKNEAIRNLFVSTAKEIAALSIVAPDVAVSSRKAKVEKPKTLAGPVSVLSSEQMEQLSNKETHLFIKFLLTCTEDRFLQQWLEQSQNQKFAGLVTLLRSKLEHLNPGTRKCLETLLQQENLFAVLSDESIRSLWLSRFPRHDHKQLESIQSLLANISSTENFNNFTCAVKSWDSDQKALLKQHLFGEFLIYLLTNKKDLLTAMLADLPQNQRNWYCVVISDFTNSLSSEEHTILLLLLKNPETILDADKKRAFLKTISREETYGIGSKRYRRHLKVFSKVQDLFRSFLAEPTLPISLFEIATKWDMKNKGTVDQLITHEIRSLLMALCAEKAPAINEHKGEITRTLPEILLFASQHADVWPKEVVKELETLLRKYHLVADFRDAVFKLSVRSKNKTEVKTEFPSGIELIPDNTSLFNLLVQYPALLRFFEQNKDKLQEIAKLWYARCEEEKVLGVVRAEPQQDAIESKERAQSLQNYQQRVKDGKTETANAIDRLKKGEIERPQSLVSESLIGKDREKEVEARIEALNQALAKSKVEVDEVITQLSGLEGPVDAKDSPQAKTLAEYLQRYAEALRIEIKEESPLKIANMKAAINGRKNALLAGLRLIEVKKIVKELLRKPGSVDIKDSERFKALENHLLTYEADLKSKDTELTTSKSLKELLNRRRAELITNLRAAEFDAFIEQLVEKSDSTKKNCKETPRDQAIKEYLENYGIKLAIERDDQKRPISKGELEASKEAKRKEILIHLRKAEENIINKQQREQQAITTEPTDSPRKQTQSGVVRTESLSPPLPPRDGASSSAERMVASASHLVARKLDFSGPVDAVREPEGVPNSQNPRNEKGAVRRQSFAVPMRGRSDSVYERDPAAEAAALAFQREGSHVAGDLSPKDLSSKDLSLEDHSPKDLSHEVHSSKGPRPKDSHSKDLVTESEDEQDTNSAWQTRSRTVSVLDVTAIVQTDTAPDETSPIEKDKKNTKQSQHSDSETAVLAKLTNSPVHTKKQAMPQKEPSPSWWRKGWQGFINFFVSLCCGCKLADDNDSTDKQTTIDEEQDKKYADAHAKAEQQETSQAALAVGAQDHPPIPSQTKRAGATSDDEHTTHSSTLSASFLNSRHYYHL